MVVFVVRTSYENDGTVIAGIWTTREQAEAQAEWLRTHQRLDPEDLIYVSVWHVGTQFNADDYR